MAQRLTVAFVALALVLAACTGPLALQVTNLTPADGAVDVSVDVVLSATFNQAIDADTVEGAFTLSAAGVSVDGAVAYNAATRTATFTPDAPLAYETTYTATVEGSVATAGGTTLAGDASWSFTTEEAPIVDAIGGVTISPAAPAVLVGDDVQLTVDFSGVTGDPDLGITWTSDDETVATVDEDGLVTGVAVGTANITATSDFDATVSDSVVVTVSPAPAVLSITLAPAAPEVEVGDDVQLTATVNVVGGASQDVSWSSDDETVATVDATGLVTAVAVGTANITATSDFDATVSGSATVTVVPVPEVVSVTVTPEDAEILVGGDVQLTADVVVIGSATAAVTWSSDDETVATVDDDGLVTGVGEGTAVITATSDFDAAFSDSATIVVVSLLEVGSYATGVDAATVVDTAFTDLTLAVTGGRAPYAFATSDALPAGVTLDAATGTISGTPTETGTFAGTVTVTDDSGQTADADFELVVVDVLGATVFLDATEDAGTTIDPLQVVPTGGLAPFTFTLVDPEPFPAPNGPLAPGLELDEETGILSGTLTVAGFFSSEILTTDALGQTATTLVEIDVSLVLIYAGSPYEYIRGCGGVGTVALCPAVTPDEPAQGNFGAITPQSDIQVIGSLAGDLTFSMARVGGGNTSGWAIAPGRGVIFRSDAATAGGFSNTGNTRNGDRSYLVTVFDEDTGETATFTVAFVEIPAP